MSAAASDLRGQLEAAMREQHAEPEVETEVVEAAEAEVESESQAQERARDEKGRFTASVDRDDARVSAAEDGEPAGTRVHGAEQSAAERAGDADGKSAVQRDADGEQQPGQSALAPPNGWTAEAKAKWHELPAEIMQAVQKREQDIAKFTSTRDEHASFGKEMYQAVQPYMPQIQAEGGTPVTAIQALLNTAYVLRTGSPEQKKQLLIQTARQYGVDLGDVPAGQPQAQPPPPDVSQLVRLEMQRAEQQRLKTEVQSEIQAFAADPTRTHYAEVKAHMAALLSAGAAKDLQDAYDQACWASPTIRATLEAQRRATEEQKRKADAKAKAEAAKRRAVSVTGGPGNTAAATAPGGRSIRDELEANLAAQSGGV